MEYREGEVFVVPHQRGRFGVVAGYYVADDEVVAVSFVVSGVWRLPVLYPCRCPQESRAWRCFDFCSSILMDRSEVSGRLSSCRCGDGRRSP